MAYVNDLALDAALDYLLNNGEKLVLCSAQPTTYAEAATTYKLAEVALIPGDFTKANGDVSGRKVTLAAKTVTGTADGTAAYYAIIDDTGTALLLENTMTNVAISNGSPQDVNAVDILEIQDPA